MKTEFFSGSSKTKPAVVLFSIACQGLGARKGIKSIYKDFNRVNDLFRYNSRGKLIPAKICANSLFVNLFKLRLNFHLTCV